MIIVLGRIVHKQRRELGKGIGHDGNARKSKRNGRICTVKQRETSKSVNQRETK